MLWAMSRPLRIELAGGLYHVTSRGDRREAIDRDAQDRTDGLAVLGAVCGRFNGRCHGAGLPNRGVLHAGDCRPFRRTLRHRESSRAPAGKRAGFYGSLAYTARKCLIARPDPDCCMTLIAVIFGAGFQGGARMGCSPRRTGRGGAGERPHLRFQ
jgi:hypothetical protein